MLLTKGEEEALVTFINKYIDNRSAPLVLDLSAIGSYLLQSRTSNTKLKCGRRWLLGFKGRPLTYITA
jgi:hypothetical protein